MSSSTARSQCLELLLGLLDSQVTGSCVLPGPFPLIIHELLHSQVPVLGVALGPGRKELMEGVNICSRDKGPAKIAYEVWKKILQCIKNLISYICQDEA